MAERAYIKRLSCGCAVGFQIKDDDTMHYIKTVANWMRSKGTVEEVTMDEARKILDHAFAKWPKGHPWKPCEPAPVLAEGT